MGKTARTLLIALALTLLSGLLIRAAMAAESTPDAPVREAYAVTIRQLAPNAKGVEPPWRPPHRDRLMSKSLAGLFARDDLFQEESGDIGHIDADPFISGQDGEVKNLRLTVSEKPLAGRALVTASFLSFKQPVSVRFRMIEEGGSWRIDDIVNRVDGKDYAVREALAQPYECGSFMKKPCKR
jgi:hypothetical protein